MEVDKLYDNIKVGQAVVVRSSGRRSTTTSIGVVVKTTKTKLDIRLQGDLVVRFSKNNGDEQGNGTRYIATQHAGWVDGEYVGRTLVTVEEAKEAQKKEIEEAARKAAERQARIDAAKEKFDAAVEATKEYRTPMDIGDGMFKVTGTNYRKNPVVAVYSLKETSEYSFSLRKNVDGVEVACAYEAEGRSWTTCSAEFCKDEEEALDKVMYTIWNAW